MATEYDKELLAFLEQEIASGNVKIYEQIEPFIEEIEKKFVMGFSRIDWQKNAVIFSENLDGNLDRRLMEGTKFLKKIGELYPSLSDEKVIVLGDGLTDLSYEMKFKDLILLSDIFFSIPQHIYIWFLKSKKCINLTFGNEIYFG